jgi:hypothetical protein
MALQKGLIGCELVYRNTEVVWPTAVQAKKQEKNAEAASDYWGLYKRQRTHVDYSNTLLITNSEDKGLFDWNASFHKALTHMKKLSKS